MEHQLLGSKMQVLVLTNLDLGWDNVLGVFATEEDIIDYFNEEEEYIKNLEELPNEYVVHREQFYGDVAQ